MVCKLQKALCGLKQTPIAWNNKLYQCLARMGFINSKFNGSLFLKFIGVDVVLILVYVDKILITGSNISTIKNLVLDLHLNFALKDLGLLHYYLWVEVTYSDEGLHLSQQKIVKELFDGVGFNYA